MAESVAKVGGDPFLQQWLRALAFVTSAPEEPATAFSEVEVDQEWREAASNTVGAWIRVAVWLSVSLRVQYGKRAAAREASIGAAALPSSRIIRMELAAVTALMNAAYGASVNATYYTTGWVGDIASRALGNEEVLRSAARDDIRAVYAIGIRKADELQTPAAARELQRLAGMEPRVDRSGPPGLDRDGDGKADIPLPVVLALAALGLVIAGGVIIRFVPPSRR